MERYMKVLKSYKRMPSDLEQTLRENVYPTTDRKHDVLQPTGTLTDNICFIEKGLFHIYAQKNGSQVTQRFKKEDEFLISWKELFPTREDQTEGIEALEDGLLWIFPGTLVSDLLEKYIELNAHIRLIIANDCVKNIQASDCSRPNAGPNNYDQLRQLAPDLLDRAPIPLLSNFTGIPEHVLSHLNLTNIRLNISTTRRRKH
jgi:hypothetical protein